ncbi:MAG: hypothetical protein ACI39F_05465 [Acutalibacteraceae bacterium]
MAENEKSGEGIISGLISGIISIVILVIFISNIFKSCGLEISGDNFTDADTYSPASVSFYPECPECGHISGYRNVNLSSGEEHKELYFCEKCHEAYVIYIKRK